MIKLLIKLERDKSMIASLLYFINVALKKYN